MNFVMHSNGRFDILIYLISNNELIDAQEK